MKYISKILFLAPVIGIILSMASCGKGGNICKEYYSESCFKADRAKEVIWKGKSFTDYEYPQNRIILNTQGGM